MLKKRELIELILENLNRELQTLLQSAAAAHEAATHEESKAEDAHDTRGLEASYLAGAQLARVEVVKKTIASYQFAGFRDFKPTDPIELGALIELELDGKRLHYFLVGQGGGMSLSLDGKTVQVITAQSPLGEALFGRRVGDVIEVEGQKLTREYEVVAVS
jgi:transcription elongation GreA/GreB family factor